MDKNINWNDDIIIYDIVKKSKSFADVIRNLGMNSKDTSVRKKVVRKIKKLGIDTNHFTVYVKNKESNEIWTKENLEKLIVECNNYKNIFKKLGVLPSAHNYKKIKIKFNEYNIDFSPINKLTIQTKIIWGKDFLEKMIIESNSKKEILLNMGLRAAGDNFKTLKKYIDKYEFDISHFEKYDTSINFNKIDTKDILVEKSTYNRTSLKDRLYKEGYKERFCEKCGQGEEWRGDHISLILDHINGVHNDNRLENLRILCPNCNAALETHCGKHKRYIVRK